MTMLIPCGDEYFVWLLGGSAPVPGLCLAPGGIDTHAVLEMLRGLAGKIRATHPSCAWLIADEHEIVGLCSLTRAADEQGVVQMGYGVAASRRGRGHAKRAVGLMIAELLNDPLVREVAAETAVANIPSQRVLESNGFARTGTRTDDEDGEVFVWRYALRNGISASK